MYILGAVTSGHDSSVCLLKDGKIAYAISDKRLSRIKYRFENNSIRKSLEYVLSTEGIDINDIALICCDTAYVYPEGETAQEIFPDYENKQNIIQLNHHLGHAASCFFPSPFDQAAILTVDACGGIAPIVKDRSVWGQTEQDLSFQGKGFIPAHEYKPIEDYTPESESLCLFKAKQGEKFHELDNYYVDSSLGFFYGHLSHYLYMEEGELMGLAGYGKMSEFYDEMKNVILLLEDGCIKINPEYMNYWNDRAPLDPQVDLSYLTEKFYETFGPKRKLHEELDERFMNFAFAVQKRLEDAILHVANHLFKLTSLNNICVAGGVGLNSLANHKIIEQTPFEHIWIQPAATDDGIALGNALFGYYVLHNLPHKKFFQMTTASTGKSYPKKEIKSLLSAYTEKNELLVEYRKDRPSIKQVFIRWSKSNETTFHRLKMTYLKNERKFVAAIPFDKADHISYFFETED